jgi:hypothetical protein
MMIDRGSLNQDNDEDSGGKSELPLEGKHAKLEN